MNSDGINRKWLFYIARLMIWGVICYALWFALWTILYTETGNGDNVEHLHVTWLVAHGKVPYRDFFQHHNPLMWYLFAPFIGSITDVIKLLDIAHAIGIFTGILTFSVAFKICKRFFASTTASMLALITLCPPYYYIYCFNYNPDTFMALFYAIGLYYLFSYWESPLLAKLCTSFFAFFISFLFTQKILMALGVLGLLSLYMFYQKKTPVKDILYALVLPILGTLLFIALLYNGDALGVYFKSNYIFNVVMQKYYGQNKINVMEYNKVAFAVGVSVLSIIGCFRSQNALYRVVAVLFVVELLLRCFYFSIAPYYLLVLMIYACCLNSVLFDKIIKKSYLSIYILLAVSLYYCYISVPKYMATRGTNREFARFIDQNVTPCDYVISSYLGTQTIISKDPHYYWSLLGHVDMAGEEIGLVRRSDVNQLVLKYNPKLVYGGVYWSSFDQNRGRSVFVQQIASEIIDQYYMPTQFPDFYILKPQYRKKNCQYDKKQKEWSYAD